MAVSQLGESLQVCYAPLLMLHADVIVPSHQRRKNQSCTSTGATQPMSETPNLEVEILRSVHRGGGFGGL